MAPRILLQVRETPPSSAEISRLRRNAPFEFSSALLPPAASGAALRPLSLADFRRKRPRPGADEADAVPSGGIEAQRAALPPALPPSLPPSLAPALPPAASGVGEAEREFGEEDVDIMGLGAGSPGGSQPRPGSSTPSSITGSQAQAAVPNPQGCSLQALVRREAPPEAPPAQPEAGEDAEERPQAVYFGGALDDDGFAEDDFL